ncbi:hypothetical protein [Endozoicomonas lisbonensis]|uniref:3-keto-disaccharide hydrolase domain-containing protein n=1 Tax=Endozoicomonas lisbonensis TaxID=3120522 RepID=A0ABV2SKV1_9GAMM
MSSLSLTLLIFSTLILSNNSYSAPVPAGQRGNEATCYTFKEKGWQFYNNMKRPKLPVVGDKQEMLLIPDNQYQTGVAAAISSPVKPPFEVTFSYSTWDDDGSEWAIWNSADGLAFFFLKDTSDYGTPPDGDSLGLKQEGDGYAVLFKLYGSRSISLTGQNNRLLDWDRFRKAYSQRQWIPVKVAVTKDRIRVYANNQPVLNHHADLHTRYSGLGFSAGTGAADAEIAVKNLCITPLETRTTQTESGEPSEPPTVKDKNFIPAPGLEGLDSWPVSPDNMPPQP